LQKHVSPFRECVLLLLERVLLPEIVYWYFFRVILALRASLIECPRETECQERPTS
jgi:hypothetical protein